MMISRLLILIIIALVLVGCTHVSGAVKQDPVLELLAQNGWKGSGPREERNVQLPADLRLQSGSFPWRIVIDLSLDVGLDPQPLAGHEVRLVSLPVEDVQGNRLEELKQLVNFRANILVDPETGHPAGAYLVQTGQDGQALDGGLGPSLSGRDLVEITGLSWPEYMQRYRAFTPPPDVLEAERQRNVIYEYFRAAATHDCGQLWSLLADEPKADSSQEAWCVNYEPLSSVRVIEIDGFAKADTPLGSVSLAQTNWPSNTTSSWTCRSRRLMLYPGETVGTTS